MYCIECGSELQSDSQFCSVCGSNQKVENQNNTSRTVSKKSSGQQRTGNNIVNGIFKLCLIIILTWAAYSFQSYSELGRYTSVGDKQGFVLDSKTGEVWVNHIEGWPLDAIKPERYSNPINIKSK